MNSSLTFLQKISVAFCVALIFLSLQGIKAYGMLYLIVFGLWLIVTIIAFNNTLKSFFSSRGFACLLIFLLFYFVSSCYAETVRTSINRCVALLYTSSPVLMYEIVKDKRIRLKKFLIIITVIIVCTNISLSYSFLETVDIKNLRYGGRDFGEDYYIANIIFNMCYMFAIIIPGLMEILRRYKSTQNNNIWIKILLLFFLIIFLVYLIRAQFVTAVIISIIGSIIAYFYKGSKSLVSLSIVLGLLVIAFIYLYPILSQSIDQDKYHDTLYRFNEVHATLTGHGDETIDLSSRQNLSAKSIATFFENPIFGINHKLVNDVHVITQGIGNHAEWPDSLARYGLFALFLFIFLWDSLKHQRKQNGAKSPTFIFIILGFLNPMFFFPQMYAAFMVLPLLNDVLLPVNTDK